MRKCASASNRCESAGCTVSGSALAFPPPLVNNINTCPRAALMGLTNNGALERMSDVKLRQAIALEAARLMYERVESEYFTAKRKAAKRLCRRGVKPEDLPSNAEIRDQIQLFARIHEGDKRTAHLRDMRLAALHLMRLLRPFRPRLIGSVMTGHVRKGSDIDLHVFTDSPGLVTDLLEQDGYQFDVERKQIVKHGESRASSRTSTSTTASTSS